MNDINFTKKEKISLKKVFDKEPLFSKWLATEGIEYIKDALGVQIIAEGTEVKPNNKFSTDIVLKVDPQYYDVPSKIVIENQYGRTDHEHFSKLITYAVANEAKYAVWIAEDIHPEHKIALDWLNENTNENINFYLFKAVIEKIGNSDQSFSLIPICEPNEEQKISTSGKRNNKSELNLYQLKFWQNFSSYIDSNNYPFKSRKASAQHWYDITVGPSCKGHISICIKSQDKKARLDYWISDNKAFFDELCNKKEAVENTVGRKLIWDRKNDAKASSISFELPNEIDIYNTEKYDDYAKIILDEVNDHLYKIKSFTK